MTRANWQLFRGSLSVDVCNELIEVLSQIEPTKAKTFNEDQSVRSSIIRWVSGYPKIEQEIIKYVNQANTAFSVDIHQSIKEIQFTEYAEGYTGFYNWHHDVNWASEDYSDRKLSVVIQLSDSSSYEGGDFAFSEVESPKQKAIRQQGSVLVFPSYLQHSVSKVTSGVRYSLVSWVTGPRWR